MAAAKIKVHFPNGKVAETSVMPYSTVKEILEAVGAPSNVYVVNDGQTLMPDWSKTMVDYNNWCIESGGFIPPLYLHIKSS